MKTDIIPFVFLLVTLFTACNTGDTAKQIPQEAENSNDNILLTSEQFIGSEMKVSKIALNNFDERLSVNGILDVPPENRASVSAYYGGYVKKITILPGQKVKRGETLFTLENPEYIKMQQSFLESKEQLEYLKSDLERQTLLAEDHISSKKNYLKVKADYQSMLAQNQSLSKQLGLININTQTITSDNIKTEIPVPSPINGFITTVNAERGKYLDPSDIATSITNTDHMHLELNVYEKDFNKLSIGQPIEFRLQNDNNRIYKAHIYLIGRSINPEQRTINVHGHLENEKDGESFAPGMYVEAEIYISSLKSPSLPQDAVVNIEDKYYVLAKQSTHGDTTTFDRKEVSIGKTSKDYVEILNYTEFNQETEFLSKGAFNLISE